MTYRLKNYWALYKLMSNDEQQAVAYSINNDLKYIQVSRSGRGGSYGTHHTDVREATRLARNYFVSENPYYHTTVTIYFKDGTSEHLDNSIDKLVY